MTPSELREALGKLFDDVYDHKLQIVKALDQAMELIPKPEEPTGALTSPLPKCGCGCWSKEDCTCPPPPSEGECEYIVPKWQGAGPPGPGYPYDKHPTDEKGYTKTEIDEKITDAKIAVKRVMWEEEVEFRRALLDFIDSAIVEVPHDLKSRFLSSND